MNHHLCFDSLIFVKLLYKFVESYNISSFLVRFQLSADKNSRLWINKLESPFRETYAKNHLFTRITFSRNICKKSSFHSNQLFEKHMQRSSNMCFNFFDLYILSQPHPKFDKRLTHFFGINFRFPSQPHLKCDKRLTHFPDIDIAGWHRFCWTTNTGFLCVLRVLHQYERER